MADTFVKPPFYSGTTLNSVNDATLGGQLTSMPTGFTQYQQNVPGDRIILDDTTAAALSNATTTLFGGIYMYVNVTWTTQAAASGAIAFFTGASVSAAATNLYQVNGDAQATTTLPAMIAGIFLNAVTKGNWGWIQVAGVANVLMDSTISSTVLGSLVIAKASAPEDLVDNLAYIGNVSAIRQRLEKCGAVRANAAEHDAFQRQVLTALAALKK